MNRELIVSKKDPNQASLVQSKLEPIIDDQILVRIDKFGITANNITYVSLGHSFQYFDFFPTNDISMAKLNVWGVATVVQSKTSILEGERIYGYFPAAQYYIMKPCSIKNTHFYVKRPHLPEDRKVYHQYFRKSGDPDYHYQFEDYMIIYRPLWGTSFFLNDFLAQKKYFGSKRIVISSASSKTAYCLASLLKNPEFEVIGLTSENNLEFVKNLSLYDRVVGYDDKLVSEYEDESSVGYIPFVYIDFAGSLELNHRLMNAYGDKIIQAVSVGMSHNNQPISAGGAKTVMFFAPDWIKKRLPVDGKAITLRRQQAWADFLSNAKRYVNLHYEHGDNVKKVYQQMIGGKINPREGYILTLADYKSKL